MLFVSLVFYILERPTVFWAMGVALEGNSHLLCQLDTSIKVV